MVATEIKACRPLSRRSAWRLALLCAMAIGPTAYGEEAPAAVHRHPPVAAASAPPPAASGSAAPPPAAIATGTSHSASPLPPASAPSAANGIAGPPAPNGTAQTAPYLLAGAPTFDTTVTKFRERYNSHNPTLPIGEFHALGGPSEPANLTRAASKINETLYASTALEKGSGKIKTLQLTYLPVEGSTGKAARATAITYMAALLREFKPTISVEQSTGRVLDLLNRGHGSRFFQQQCGALRYVVADNGDKGLTFAVEPVKLALAEP